jgi:pyrroline-5-carboxylate reductase
MDKLGFIGAGNMAQALIKGLIKAETYSPSDIIASDISAERLKYVKNSFGIDTTPENKQIADRSSILVLSVKPQNIKEVLEEIKTNISHDKIIISIAAGITTRKIADHLGDVPIIRVMPNTPALVSAGAAALYGRKATVEQLDKAARLFLAVGQAVIVEDEKLIDAVTATSGSGPAYFFLLMENMIKSAVKLGLTEDIAKKLVLQTALGAAKLAKQADKNNESPEELRKKVTSPGGTTEAAIKVFADEKIEKTIENALTAAYEKSKKLSG